MTGTKLRRARRLSDRVRVGVCAPAGPVENETLDAGLAWLDACGFEVRCSDHLRHRSGFLAGEDSQRLADLASLVDDPEVAVIMAARGGYGIPGILDRIDIEHFVRERKLLIGYSDATALSLRLFAAGLCSIHGPMLERTDISSEARERLLALASGAPQALEPLEGKAVAGGRAEGILVGGNLKLLAASLGTAWEVQTEGAILFFEEVAEQPYAIDRSLQQLREAGKLRAARGVAVGALVNCESPRYPEVSASDVIRDLLTSEVDGPVVTSFPFGHIADNRALGVGARAEVDGNNATLRLLEAVVED